MTQPGRTWWGQRFLEVLESFTEPGRLQRGRSYTGPHRLKKFTTKDGVVTATVRGNVNPYYGVYTEPQYQVNITLKQFPEQEWNRAIATVAKRADLVIALLMHEMPDNIDDAFGDLDVHLLPRRESDFATSCTCPDYANPCKHVAGVYYRLAADLDQDPFLLFELRGLTRDQLRDKLSDTPLGESLAAELASGDGALVPSSTFFTEPLHATAGTDIGHRAFWTGARPLPTAPTAPSPPVVTALLIKAHGDYPAFWHKDHSFVQTMEELYARVRSKSSQMR